MTCTCSAPDEFYDANCPEHRDESGCEYCHDALFGGSCSCEDEDEDDALTSLIGH